MKNNIVDDIITFIHDQSTGVTSRELAEKFLKFKSPDNTIAHATIRQILKNDLRCIYTSDNLWHYDSTVEQVSNELVHQMPWVTVYLLSHPNDQSGKIFHISIWSLFKTPDCIASEWISDPALLPHNERETLVDSCDSPFINKQVAFSRIADTLKNRIILYFSHSQQRNLMRHAAHVGITITDDSMLISQLFSINHLPIPKPFSPATGYTQLFKRDTVIESACHYGKAFSEIARELILTLSQNGITDREQLETHEQRKTLQSTWNNAHFSLTDILQVPERPGVYGFKDKRGVYIYIGKAINLRKRLLSYFRNTEESPEKLLKLRDQAEDFTIHECGSELESLILEYRLIRKHAPTLNAKVHINERKGYYRPLHDCIILLPHVDPAKCMSCWFREDQKSLLKPLTKEYMEGSSIIKELGNFFFTPLLSAQHSDFPEQEIIFRWVKQHEETLQIIPVYRMSSPEDIFSNLKGSWKNITP